jgi:ethanolamine ammonia-lyase large subunit
MEILDEGGRVRPMLQEAGGAANLLTYAEAAHHG